MKDRSATNKELLKEISALKRRIQELERSESEHKRTSEALIKSEEKFRKAFYTSPDSVNINRLDDGLYVSINRGFTRILGYTEKDIIGKTSVECNIWNNIEDRQRLVAGLKKGGSVSNLEAGFRTKNGTIVQGLMSASVIDLDGVPHILSITREITDRLETEKAVRESEKQYRLLADNVNDVIFVSDMNLKYSYISPSVKAFRGYEPEEIFNQSLSETLTPASWELAMETMAEVMELEKSGDRELSVTRTLELEMYRKDGTTVWAEVKLSLIRDENQQPTGILGVSRNIDDRKREEEKLKRSEAFLNKIIEQTPNPIWISDEKGMLIRINPACCNLLNITKEEVLGKYNIFEDNIVEEQGFLPLVQSVFKEGRSVRFDLKYNMSQLKEPKVQGDKPVVLDVTIFPIMEPGGRVVNAVIQHIDITDRKRAEKERTEAFTRLRKTMTTSIQVMVSAVEARDPYTAGHQIRSAELARAIATEMGLPEETIEGIYLAASIHDIGKLSIPAEILSKPTQLSDTEFLLVKEHPLNGYEILKNVETDWPLAEIVYQHHERIDGSGYPRNLKGEEILTEARILAVADVVEATASHRPYRPALGVETALEEISKNRGILYDPEVADVCLKLFREKGYRLDVSQPPDRQMAGDRL